MSDEEMIEDFMEYNEHQGLIVKEIFLTPDRFYSLINTMKGKTKVDKDGSLVMKHSSSQLTVRPYLES